MAREPKMHDKPITSDDVRDFFAAVLVQDATALQCIEQSAGGLELRPEGFVFSLPALHVALDPDKALPTAIFASCCMPPRSTRN